VSIYDPRLKPRIGSMNGDTLDQFGEYLTDDTLQTDYALGRSVEKSLEDEIKVKFPRKAVCVFAEEFDQDPENVYTPVWNVATPAFGFNQKKRIRVKAYDDLIHSAITIPNLGVPREQWTDLDNVSFNLLPWYYLDNDQDIDMAMPAVGDTVMVDYFDQENVRGGILVSVRERINVTPFLNSLAGGANAFAAAAGAIGSLFSNDPGSAAATPLFSSISDLCSGPVVTIYGGSQVETVIIDGCPVNAEYAGYYLSLRDAAARDGITLKLNSALRTDEDIRVPDDCGNGTKSGQISLYNRLGPGIAAKPGGGGGHKIGRAFDMNTGMANVQVPQPDALSATYKWMMQNCHKFGFVRTVRSERWHWEYLPGKTQFYKVAKDHPTWDNWFLMNPDTSDTGGTSDTADTADTGAYS